MWMEWSPICSVFHALLALHVFVVLLKAGYTDPGIIPRMTEPQFRAFDRDLHAHVTERGDTKRSADNKDNEGGEQQTLVQCT